jgi:hypothetical protein
VSIKVIHNIRVLHTIYVKLNVVCAKKSPLNTNFHKLRILCNYDTSKDQDEIQSKLWSVLSNANTMKVA